MIQLLAHELAGGSLATQTGKDDLPILSMATFYHRAFPVEELGGLEYHVEADLVIPSSLSTSCSYNCGDCNTRQYNLPRTIGREELWRS